MTFHVWPLSNNTRFSRVIHLVTCMGASFVFITEYYSIVWMDHICLSFQPLMGTWVVSAFGSRHLCVAGCCSHLGVRRLSGLGGSEVSVLYWLADGSDGIVYLCVGCFVITNGGRDSDGVFRTAKKFSQTLFIKP